MQIYPHLVRDDTAKVTVRLNQAELAALRRYMKTPDHYFAVGFPHGIRLFYRSKGWYSLEATRDFRACEKLKLVLLIVRKFYREYQELLAIDQRIKAAVVQPTPEKTIIAYTGSDERMAGNLHFSAPPSAKARTVIREKPRSSKHINKQTVTVHRKHTVTNSTVNAGSQTSARPTVRLLQKKQQPSPERLAQLEAMFSHRKR